MKWSSGFSAMYELRTVDPVSWLDQDTKELICGTVTRTDSGLIESANLNMTERVREQWVRVYLKAFQGSDSLRVPIFTGLAMTPQRDLDGWRESYSAKCYSVLKPASDTLTPRGYYVPSGVPGAIIAAELLSIGPAPVIADEHSPDLLEPIIMEDKDTNLSAAWKVLDAIGWRIRINGDGSIRLCAAASEPSSRYDIFDNDAIEPRITDSADWYNCPNCIRVVSGNKTTVVKDEDPESMLSISARKAARGGTGEIWKQETASSIGTNESLAEYAMRKLKEAQSYSREIHYYRRFRPDLTVTDIVELHYPNQGIVGNFRIKSQTLTLGFGLRTDEKVVEA